MLPGFLKNSEIEVMGSPIKIDYIVGIGKEGVIQKANLFETELAIKTGDNARIKHEVNVLESTDNQPGKEALFAAENINGYEIVLFEFINGVSLTYKVQTIVKDFQKMPFRTVLSYANTLGSVLLDMHSGGWVSANVSPSNCLVSGDEITLVNFGNSTPIGTKRQTNLEPGYNASEQVNNFNLVPRTDVYGLAATLVYCLTGRAPLSANKRLGRKLDIESLLKEYNPSASDHVIKLLSQAMNLNILARPNLEDFLRVLNSTGSVIVPGVDLSNVEAKLNPSQEAYLGIVREAVDGDGFIQIEELSKKISSMDVSTLIDQNFFNHITGLKAKAQRMVSTWKASLGGISSSPEPAKKLHFEALENLANQLSKVIDQMTGEEKTPEPQKPVEKTITQPVVKPATTSIPVNIVVTQSERRAPTVSPRPSRVNIDEDELRKEKDIQDSAEHSRNLESILAGRLRVLEEQAARMGWQTDASVRIEIDNAKKTINEYRKALGLPEWEVDARAEHRMHLNNLLSHLENRLKYTRTDERNSLMEEIDSLKSRIEVTP
jgi:serine/threonine protein kinase